MRQRSCLVDAQDRRGAQRLDGLRLTGQDVRPGEPPAAQRQHHAPDDRKLFGNQRHRERQPHQQALGPRSLAQREYRRRDQAGTCCEQGDTAHQPVQLCLQPARSRGKLDDDAVDVAQRRVRPCGRDLGHAITAHDQAAREQPSAFAVSRGTLVLRNRLTGAKRLVDLQTDRFEQLRIGGQSVALAHHQPVAAHQFATRDVQGPAGTHDRAAWAGQILQCLEHARRALLLVDRQPSDGQDGSGEHAGVAKIAEHRVQTGSGQQQQEHRLRQRIKGDAKNASVRTGGKNVRPVAVQAPSGLLVGQAGG